jgi:hypothetical protein
VGVAAHRATSALTAFDAKYGQKVRSESEPRDELLVPHPGLVWQEAGTREASKLVRKKWNARAR